jgi:uncharacterized protein
VRLHAWHAVALDGAPTLVWSHGNAGNIAGRVPVLHALAARGLGVLAYDYRGYGRSGGTPNEAGVSRDVEAAYDSVALPGARIVAFGESLGAAAPATGCSQSTSTAASGCGPGSSSSRSQKPSRSRRWWRRGARLRC